MEHEGDSDNNCSWCTWSCPQRIGKGTGRIRNQKTSRKHLDYRITKISQNTVKRPGDLKRLAVTQSPASNHQLTLVLKTLKGVNNNKLYLTREFLKTET